MWLVKSPPAPSFASLPTTTNTMKIYCQFHVTFSSLPSTLFLLPIKTLIFYGLEERLNIYTWLKSIEDYSLVCSILMFSWMIHLWSSDVMEYYSSRWYIWMMNLYITFQQFNVFIAITKLKDLLITTEAEMVLHTI